jgi:hypothetical protein
MKMRSHATKSRPRSGAEHSPGRSPSRLDQGVKPTWRIYEYTWHARACPALSHTAATRPDLAPAPLYGANARKDSYHRTNLRHVHSLQRNAPMPNVDRESLEAASPGDRFPMPSSMQDRGILMFSKSKPMAAASTLLVSAPKMRHLPSLRACH